ncbi:MAG: alanine--tRNA ligase [Helicobacteraceae bacterium]|jgi:alanyl-tRNA synthetase|nr:alanine--tRNA ligase [Helicobacteraceae bacterium]
MEIRRSYLEFFAGKNHVIAPSSPLVPSDPTLLFTNAGMVQFKPVFTGEVPPPQPPRAATSQVCIRAGGKHNDLENVGYTARHHTMFEMLGNFSFGDYFKKEAISYAWEFLTGSLNLPKERLYISIHESDDEAEAIWLGYVPKERIGRFGDKDNFWQMGEVGPCGPCSEIYYDQGADRFGSGEDYFGGDGDRFLEVWNLVFMQYNRDEKGTLHPLPKPSIDTGMGLERITAVKEGVFSNYDSSLFRPLLDEISRVTKKPYDPRSGSSHRVIADHLRSVAFLLAQGVSFDNEGRGYVLRRILRRAARHGYLLGVKEPFLYRLNAVLAEQMKDSYPYLLEQQGSVSDQIKAEEARFFATLVSGMKLFETELEKSGAIFSGESAFKLYDTYGFPLDLTQDMLRAHNIRLDTEGFDRAMKRQKETAKAAWKGSGDKSAQGDFGALIEEFGLNVFVGYDTLETESRLLALLDQNRKKTSRLEAGEIGFALLDKTPLYATSGGQVGDCGALKIGDRAVAIVLQTDKYFGLNISKIAVKESIEAGAPVLAEVARFRRLLTERHHSAAHLLHSALIETLGENTTQAGSEVSGERLRFDFSYPKALSKEQLDEIENRVNEMIFAAIDSVVEELPIEEAKKRGAKALFSEKYGEMVRVVSFGGESVEFCGGTHVKNTSHIGAFAIIKESGVSAGVRRIEAAAASAALSYFKEIRNSYDQAVGALKTKDISSAIAKLIHENKKLQKESGKSQSGKEIAIVEIGGVILAVDTIPYGNPKETIDDLKNRFNRIAATVFCINGGKVSAAAGTKNVPFDADKWLSSTLSAFGGKSGGRGDFASGGGIAPGLVEDAKKLALESAKEAIKKKPG